MKKSREFRKGNPAFFVLQFNDDINREFDG
jgi:hypothetical protein